MRATCEAGPQRLPAGLMPDHEGLGDLQARVDTVQRSEIGAGQPRRLLDQDVLARVRGLARPFDVQMVGQRHVDDLDLRIGEQCIIGAVGLGDAAALGQLAARPLSRAAMA